MSIHKLTAGSGYDYLTRQVAAMDATDKGHAGLASYYTEKGETPGVWVGSGMEGIDGLEAGDVVTADHMQNLFGAGHHPLATERTKQLDLRIGRPDQPSPTAAERKAATRLGTPYKVYENDVSPFRVEVAKRLSEVNEAAGLPGDWPVPAAERAKIRAEVAREFFRAEHGRDPDDARELAATIAKHSRPKTTAVAGYDLTFSPVKSVSTLWAVADPKTAAVIERAHQSAITDALDFIENKALFTRMGTNGVRQVNVRGLVATAFTHRDSRAGDPDLHTHHAVSVALHQHGRDRYHDAREAGRPIRLSSVQTPYAVAPTSRWIQRMAVCEKAAGDYVNGRFAQALAGEATRPLDDPGRLHRALTAWDIQAHRTLASGATPGNIVLVTRTQVLIAGAGTVLVGVAAGADLLSSPTSERLIPAIEEAGRAWSNLASRWSDLTGPGTRVDGNLARAAAEVRAACRELTHDKTTLGSVEEIAAQPGLVRAATAILHALDAASDLAYVVAEQAARDDLTGPARALSRRAHNDVEAGLATPQDGAGDIVWVSPADILAKRNIPLPMPVAEALRRAGAAVIEATCTMACAAPAALASTPTDSHVQPRATREVYDQTPEREHAELRHRALPAHRRGRTTSPGR